jgi:hypothetical protein
MVCRDLHLEAIASPTVPLEWLSVNWSPLSVCAYHQITCFSMLAARASGREARSSEQRIANPPMPWAWRMQSENY